MPAVWGVATHAKIASGQTVSGEVDLRGQLLIGIQYPAAFTGATVTFQTAEKPLAEGGFYSSTTSYSTGTGAAVAISLTAGASTTVFLNAEPFGNCMVRVVSASAEGADRDLILYTRPY